LQHWSLLRKALVRAAKTSVTAEMLGEMAAKNFVNFRKRFDILIKIDTILDKGAKIGK
jgi:hypothetical protein